MPIPPAIEEWSNLHAELLGDVIRAAADANSANDGYSQRCYVRTVFASIEGDLFGLRQVTMERMKDTNYRGFDKDELEKLIEAPIIIGQTSRPRFLKFGEGIKFTFGCVAKVHGFQFAFELNADWKALLEGAKVRDRLMHPKHLADLTVSDLEHIQILRGARWYHWHRNHLMQQAAEALHIELNNRSAMDFLIHLDALCQNSAQHKPKT